MLDKNLLNNLECSYLDAAHSILGFLRECIATDEAIKFEDQIVFGANGSYSEVPRRPQDLWKLFGQRIQWDDSRVRLSLQAHWDAIFINMLQLDGLLPAPSASPPIFERHEPILRQIFITPVLQALQIQREKSMDNPWAPWITLTEDEVSSVQDDTIVIQYRHLRTLWLSSMLEWQVTAPIQHFDASLLNLPIQLTPSFSLTNWTPEDKTQLWNDVVVKIGARSHPQDLNIDHFLSANYCLKNTVTLPRNPIDAPSVGANAIVFLTTLRLIRPGPVRLACVFMEAPIGAIFHRRFLVGNPSDMKLGVSASQYQLQPDDVPLLQSLVAGVQCARQTSSHPAGLGLALNRFDQSYSRLSQEDIIVDLTIALESTLLAGLGGGELSYRFALLGAALLANKRPAQETFDLLASIYKIRSKIVHEGETLLNKNLQKLWKKFPGIATPAQFVEVARNITREVLSTYTLHLANGENPQMVQKRLEHNILKMLESNGNKQAG